MQAPSVALLTIALLVPASLAAQTPTLPEAAQAVTRERTEPARVDVSVLATRFAFTDWSDRVVLGSLGPAGTIEQIVIRDLGMEPATGIDATVTYWRGRWGFRVHGGFAPSCVGLNAECPAASGVDVNAYLVDVGGAVGLRRADPQHVVRPYAFAGAGVVAYDLERTIGPDFLTRFEGQRDRPVVIIDDDTEQFLLSVDELDLEAELAVVFGVGSDFVFPVGDGAIGLRLELADHISRSPVDLRLTTFDGFFGELPSTDLDFGSVHHFRVSAGLVFLFDLD